MCFKRGLAGSLECDRSVWEEEVGLKKSSGEMREGEEEGGGKEATKSIRKNEKSVGKHVGPATL